MPLVEGTKLGPYRILNLLGRGGMGEVYRAEDERLGRQVAIKILPPELSRNRDSILRFEREVKALASLSHPNVLTIFDIGMEEGISFAVMELLVGETLRSFLEREPAPRPRVLPLAISMAEGLAAAHSQNIVHRDFKPENIFLTADGGLKILDFGLAAWRLQDPQGSQVETQTGVVAGTVPYMSPEQLRGGMADSRSDVFAFGCVLAEMFTGISPFRRASQADTISAILREKPNTGSKRLQPAIQRLIHRCLEKDPSARFQNAQEIANDLKDLSDLKPRPSSKKSSRKFESLAILPFENASEDPDMEYLSDGITETLINSLSHLPRLRVMARGTVFHYTGQQMDPVEIGKRLNVGAVLTGRVIQRGDQLFVSTELMEVANGWHLWGEQYHRKMADVFALQSGIASEISDKLKIKLTGKEKRILTKHYTENAEAYEKYLRGRYYWNRRTEDGFRKALHYFRQAIDIDPLYALAYTGLADSYALLGDFGIEFTPREAFSRSKAAVLRALEIDPDLAEAHTSLGHLKMHEFHWDEAADEFQKAKRLNPGYATAPHWYFMSLTMRGKNEDAQREMKKAEELDPLSSIIQTDIAACHYFVGNYDLAIRILQRTLALDANFASAHRFLAAVFEQKGLFSDAIDEFQKARLCSGKNPEQVASDVAELRNALTKGENGYWQMRLEQSEKQSRKSYVPPYNRAQLYASLGKIDRAFELLNDAYQEPSASMIYLRVDPRFHLLRKDPRFADLLKKINLL